MSLAELLFREPGTLADSTGRIYGVVVGVVSDNQDPQDLGRVKAKLPWLAADAETHWARIAVPMAGNDRGLFYLPEVGDEVLIAFEHGDVRFPYVLGALWNGKDAPPGKGNDKRVIKSRSGMTITLDDTAGGEQIVIADKDGNDQVVIDAANKKISLQSSGDLDIEASSGTITINAKTLKLGASGQGELKTQGQLDIGGSTVNIKGQPTVNIN